MAVSTGSSDPHSAEDMQRLSQQTRRRRGQCCATHALLCQCHNKGSDSGSGALRSRARAEETMRTHKHAHLALSRGGPQEAGRRRRRMQR